MLEQKMLNTAYPLLLRLMSDYGHSTIELKIDKAFKPINGERPASIKITIRSDGTIRLYIASSESKTMEASISSKAKKCPLLNYVLANNYYITEGDTYIRYCSLIVAEIEKYKALENEATKVLDRIDSFNMPLTRFVLIEKCID